MKWIIGGPDLPSELLQLMEEGRLVFFCGAGVSYPTGLPGFRDLVEQVYERLHERKSDLEQFEFDRSKSKCSHYQLALVREGQAEKA